MHLVCGWCHGCVLLVLTGLNWFELASSLSFILSTFSTLPNGGRGEVRGEDRGLFLTQCIKNGS